MITESSMPTFEIWGTPVRVGITIGDPGGIGPEVALKAMAEMQSSNDWQRRVAFVLVGPEALWREYTERLVETRPDWESIFRNALENAEFAESDDPEAGTQLLVAETSSRHGNVARAAIERGVEMAMEGKLDAVVTAPISKLGLKKAGCNYPGHTEMLRDLTGAKDATMAFVGGGLRLGLVTVHVPLRAVFDMLTPELILAKARHLNDFLINLGIAEPVIGVCGLNPHAGEGGLFGNEEETIIEPAINKAYSQGIKLRGPIPADTIFHTALDGRYDAVLAMYHDQGLIGLKTLAFDTAVNVSLGLPIIRTSPDHGTAFNIAGRGIARHGSMSAAIHQAIKMATRKQQDQRIPQEF